MKLYTCNDFEGHYPVGTSAVILANSIEEARTLLLFEMRKHGLDGDSFELIEVDISQAKAIILQDGDY